METSTPDTFTHLFYGYLVFWGLIGGYVWSMGRRLKNVEQKLKTLTAAGEDK